jgi:hypothetical protein
MNTSHNWRARLPLCAALIAVLTTACGLPANDAAANAQAAPADKPQTQASAAAIDPAYASQFVRSTATVAHAVSTAASATAKDTVADLDWTDLQPKNDPDKGYISNKPIDHTGNVRMPQSGSFNTVQALDGKRVRLPGYVVPLQTDDSGRMQEFFFVPFYGACIHVPPPPPNQMLFAKMLRPIKTPDMYTAMSIIGTLRASKHDDPLASAAYTINDAALSVYKDESNNN